MWYDVQRLCLPARNDGYSASRSVTHAGQDHVPTSYGMCTSHMHGSACQHNKRKSGCTQTPAASVLRCNSGRARCALSAARPTHRRQQPLARLWHGAAVSHRVTAGLRCPYALLAGQAGHEPGCPPAHGVGAPNNTCNATAQHECHFTVCLLPDQRPSSLLRYATSSDAVPAVLQRSPATFLMALLQRLAVGQRHVVAQCHHLRRL